MEVVVADLNRTMDRELGIFSSMHLASNCIAREIAHGH